LPSFFCLNVLLSCACFLNELNNQDFEYMRDIKVHVRLKNEANNNDHWRVKHKRKNNIRAMLEKHWLKGFVPILPCTIELVRGAPRRCDSDNLQMSLKSVREFVADKFIPGLAPGRADDDDRIKFSYSQERRKVREYALIIRLTF